MMRLKLWQWIVLAVPLVLVVGFLLIAAGWQMHEWHLNWIWAIFTLVFVGWRWLLVRWTQPVMKQVEAAITQVSEELQAAVDEAVAAVDSDVNRQTEAALQAILKQSQTDPLIWEDWQTFWQRCQEVVVAVAQVYHPEVKYPLLNIYIPQAYELIRGTVDDLDLWMKQLSPVLNQVTIGQGYQAFEVYRSLEPSARKLWQAWNWAQWVLNPVAAVARQVSEPYSNQANQQLLVNLGQLLREAALRNLWRQAIILYSGTAPETPAVETLTAAKTQTLREILAQAEPVETLEQKPVNILLVGRTGAGKSSLINTLFEAELAAVSILPSTDQIRSYQWQTETGETLSLWDTPGYEQVKREDFRQQVLDYAKTADLLLLVTPALDPALQMDADFLKAIKTDFPDLTTLTVVTQVDRLRPVREWQPPYDWQWGTRPKEIAIRETTTYRAQILGDYCERVLPLVTADQKTERQAWGAEALSLALIEALSPAKQFRLARFLRNLDARTLAAATIIERYAFQMTTTQGLTALLKSPLLFLLSQRFRTLSPTTPLLAEQIPIEQVPVVIGKLQMAYELFSLLNTNNSRKIDLPILWSLLLMDNASPQDSAWALGQALVEYWSQHLTAEQLQIRYQDYLNQWLLQNQ